MRVQILKQEFGDRLELEWRSFLLRPHAGNRNLEKFRRYTQSWLKVAEDQPAGSFSPWSTDEDPPSHSVPPHLVVKAASELGEDAFDTMHEALLKAYFVDNRDISNDATLRAIWHTCGFDPAQFEQSRNPEILKTVIDEHNEAITCGASGAPAFRMSQQNVALVGALPVEAMRRWIYRILDEEV